MITTSENDIKERLSIAYITAVAARAGCQVMAPSKDMQSIDAIISPISGRKDIIFVQLKATSVIDESNELFFDLPVKNYDDLRQVATTPHYLVVLKLPADKEKWFSISAEELILKGCAYFIHIQGLASTSNTTTCRIKMQKSQIFNVQALENMIKQCPNFFGQLGE
jgi:Domain of unknown function (DUF4365)